MLKHNKKKNVGIIYEQLLALTTRLALSDKKDEASFVVEIIKKHFSKNSLLNKERQLIENISKSKVQTKEEAEKVLEEALSEAAKIPLSQLEKLVSNLVEDISNNISKQLYDIPVKNYKVFASAHILLTEFRNSYKNTTPTERVEIKKYLCENLVGIQEEVKKDKVDNLTYNLAVNKFNKKYSKLMSEDQKDVLKNWSEFLMTNNEEKLLISLNEKLSLIKKCLNKEVKLEKHKENDYATMLKEAQLQIKDLKITEVTEDSVYEVMRYLDLVEDLEQI